MIKTLYFETSPEQARDILRGSATVPGSHGFAGPGIYLAAQPAGNTCQADLGRVLKIQEPGNKTWNLCHSRCGYDTVSLQGVEYVVYDAARISGISLHSGQPTPEPYRMPFELKCLCVIVILIFAAVAKSIEFAYGL
ncbi:hypothetical protein GPECTOR_113g286 [Gonium pectorale]|uniref:PARP catalytic domain-containing protein n=1 Tax=Gonium pectorale TaxID=33097 RepID=A0A150FZ45_GONPE|nr:hypothetical protein GPECTOR_113g286 [Gonium pectorale]|eukprot:KXZ42874.1 hypothetical protein GPECTOR_113g286 [Gonium pectorale]